jgi:hypothetical protein
MDHSQEVEPAANWLVRAYHTPLRDALRGHLSGRLDVRREIAAAGLSAPIAGLIYTVVRRTRLWRREKLDVARELAAHFADGLAAGRSPELLIEDFGSPNEAAKLIRQAKRRNRPLYWQAWWYASRGFVALVVLSIVGYGLLAARFYLARPTITHNYWNEINAARRVPEDQRAWPLYRAALIKLGKEDSQLLNMLSSTPPEDDDWQEMATVAERHRESIELAREAARKPHLGYLLGDPADRAASADWILTPGAPVAEDNPYLLGVLLDGISGMRQLARLLAADARRAAAAGDGATALADLSALVSMADQTFQPRALIVEQLVGYAIFSLAADGALAILAEYPALLTDAQLRDLAHEFAAFRQGSPTVDWTAERIAFDDMLQRSYTDEGTGDGRLAEQGLSMLPELLELRTPRWDELLGPGMAALVGSRQENRELFNSYLDEMIALHQVPPWQWDYDAVEASEQRLHQALGGATGRIRYLFVFLLLPPVQPVFNVAQRAIQERDATEVAIALVLWHRKHGDWPARLDQLVPDLLPAVPPDRYDGRPLRYVVRQGQPIVYSIGRDRDDDGGTPTAGEPFVYYDGRSAAQRESTPKGSTPDDGDWVLWPPQKPEEEDQAK